MTQGKDDDGFSLDDPGIIILGLARIHLLFNGGDQDIWPRLPLPGTTGAAALSPKAAPDRGLAPQAGRGLRHDAPAYPQGYSR